MSQYCQAACSFCSGSAFGSTWNTQACSNGNPSCFSWTSSGQCSINRAYMWENCRQSCGVWSRKLNNSKMTARPTALHTMVGLRKGRRHTVVQLRRQVQRGPARPTGRPALPLG
ncbi:hypothetical protein ANCCAN_17845 [Ancylostoma caninum]|uniref:ShKT domain-containing protein n=1 Tax=Ancylostoma caninum TaxID=29170 RepID=A0A368FZS0_ANCCA|nr:hypothetical protein ANCCAN_17845 [Ancylostoma caninum]